MVGGYEVRQARLEDWPAIARFIAITYGAQAPYKQRARWDWAFLHNPFNQDSDGRVPVWIALHRGEVAGQIALQPGRIWLRGVSYEAGWIVDVMVHPEHRGRGVGHLIQQAMKATGRTLVTLTMAEATRRMAEKAGCITLAPVRQMVRIGRLRGDTAGAVVRPILQRRPRLRGIGRWFERAGAVPMAAAGLASAAAAARRLALPRTASGDIRSVDRIDASVADRLFARAAAAIPGLWDRGGTFCRWRFDAEPVLRYNRALLLRGGEAEGQVVWRLPEPMELNVGTLADVLADPADGAAIEALTAHAVSAMAPHCEAIIAGASHPGHIRALRRAGFVTVKTHRPTVVCADPAVLARFAAIGEGWHFTKADHDWDQLHPVVPWARDHT